MQRFVRILLLSLILTVTAFCIISCNEGDTDTTGASPITTVNDSQSAEATDSPLSAEETASDVITSNDADTSAEADTSDETSDETYDETSDETSSVEVTDALTEPVAEPESKFTEIVFNGTSFTTSTPDAVSVSGTSLLISAPGIYKFSGNMDGQILVDAGKESKVTIILDNFNGKCTFSAPVYVKSADKVVIKLEKDTENFLTDTETYILGAGVTKPNACIYSDDDLDITGDGKLTVNALYNNGIGCKNDIEIKGGNIIIDAVNNAIKARDSIEVKAGNIEIRSCEDGLKVESEVEGKGYITINGSSTLSINCSDDAIQASLAVTVQSPANINAKFTGFAVNCPGTVSVDEGCITENKISE